MTHLFGLVFLIVSVVYLAVSVPKLAYYTILLSQRRNPDIAPSWRDIWGLNHANLIFFPSHLDDEGKKFQKLAVAAFAKMMVGVVAGIFAFYLSGKLQ